MQYRFRDSEKMYNSRPLPVTKAEVNDFKEKLRAINSRPIKKIAEAQSRKKQAAVRRWEKLKAKAEVISNAETGSQEAKLRTIAKLYKKSDPRTTHTDKVYVVNKKAGGQVRANKGRGKIVNVDKRLKNDMKAQRRSRKHAEGKAHTVRKKRKRG